GPFNVAPGGQRDVSFRNVFADAMDFTFTCDNPAFAVMSGERQNVPGKSSKSVTIKFTPEVRTTMVKRIAGKLIVQCADVAAAATPPWVFYLHGVPPPQST
ncbi:unnamed protein product, partial [Sphacelaria rigidula]